MSEFILKGTDEEIKNEVLTMLYNTGRINGLYFGRKSRANHNGIKGYINMWLKRFRLDQNNDVTVDLCEECYNTVFYHLVKTKAEKIVEIVKESPNKLLAIACKIVLRQCFAKKDNPTSSGIVWNLLNNSSYQNVEINTSEVIENVPDGNYHNTLIITDEDDVDEFQSKYNFTVEEIISRMTDDERAFFYSQLQVQSVGKPSRSMVEKRETFKKRMNQIRIELQKENRKYDR